MKKIKFFVSTVLVLSVLMSTMLLAYATSPEDDFTQKVIALGEKYGFDVTADISQATVRSALTSEQQEEQLAALEARLIAGQEALEENNRKAAENWASIVADGRYAEDAEISENAVSPRATYTVYYFQNIGSYYPGATTIRCYITGNKVYNDIAQRYLWGTVVSKGSRLNSGMGDSWDETDCTVDRIDGGRTYYVQVWGDLKEKYTIGAVEYTVTSKGWRIWYEAYCPA